MNLRMLWVALGVATWAAPAAAEEPFPAWGFELRLGSYQPAVGDQTIGSSGKNESDYYQLFFKDDRPLMFAVEFDRYLGYAAGHLGFFLQIGLWKASGKSRTCADATGADVACTSETIFTDSRPGNDKTQIQIIPLAVGFIYRFDLAQRLWGVPLVPYGKLGFTTSYWRSTGGGTLSSFANGSQGSGWTTGMKAAGGLAVNFGFLTPPDSLEHTLFVDSYFFVELDHTWADGFGDQTKFDMSDTQLQFGVSFDFE